MLWNAFTILITAGPIATMKNDGKKHKIIGNSIFVPIFAACSSAFCAAPSSCWAGLRLPS